MKIIGITGGIGSGKSTVLKLLKEEYNAYIVETDVLAHKLMQRGNKTYINIVNGFGEAILDENKEIDRAVLGTLVFQHEEKLQLLNSIVHPDVKQYIRNDIDAKKQQGKVDLYIIEAALLIEDGYKEICDEIWYIYADEELRIKRLLNSRGGTRQKWLNVIRNQANDKYYRDNCEHIVNNDEDFVKTSGIIKELLFSR
ncbi:MAG: dephospho-CoA kinase [Lachnospiraceae bacterium]